MFKQIIFYGLRFEQFIDGELVEIGAVRKRTKDNIIGILKRQGYSITLKGKAMPSPTSPITIDANHRKALRQILADPQSKLNKITESAMQRRGYINHYEGGEIYITDEGLKFLNADEIADAKIIAPAQPKPQPQIAAPVDNSPTHIAPFMNDETHTVLRDMRDAALSLVESVVSQKAPEVLPVLAQVRRVNQVLGE